ncbi:MAG: hypothetical protein AAGD43_13295 [Pseudomonadota bacterium]
MNSLRTYAEWKHCIVELCQIQLTQAFVAERLEELRDEDNEKTRKFVSKWGDKHRKQVITWFERAQTELADASHVSH